MATIGHASPEAFQSLGSDMDSIVERQSIPSLRLFWLILSLENSLRVLHGIPFALIRSCRYMTSDLHIVERQIGLAEVAPNCGHELFKLPLRTLGAAVGLASDSP